MVCIAEDDLCPHLAQFARVNRLHAPLRAHGHENRRVHDAMRGSKATEARFAGEISFEKLEHEVFSIQYSVSSEERSYHF
jgi:hypothetical protein